MRYESNNTTRSIKIGWNEPEDPNGLIKKYLLEYRRSDNVELHALAYFESFFVYKFLSFRAKLLENASAERSL